MPALGRDRERLRPRQYTTAVRALHKHPVTAERNGPGRPLIEAVAPRLLRRKFRFAIFEKVITLGAKHWSCDGFLSCCEDSGALRRNRASRPVVAGNSAGDRGARRVRRVRHSAGLRGGQLSLGPVSFAFLLAFD